jgi:hypothetical protein
MELSLIREDLHQPGFICGITASSEDAGARSMTSNPTNPILNLVTESTPHPHIGLSEAEGVGSSEWMTAICILS